ncbi:MAG: molybdenum cofactor guanylyltransferase [Planctomycetota bacterium]
MRCGAVILCGGRSIRMGQDKAWLLIDGETMLERVVRTASGAVAGGPVVVVAAAGQGLPKLGPNIAVRRDAAEERGPLEGLRVGLSTLSDSADAVFVTGCDAPLLTGVFIEFLFNALGSADAAVSADDHRLHPLAAVYRPNLLGNIEQLMREGASSLHALLESCKTARIDAEQRRRIDSDLRCLMNVNRHEDYQRAIRLLAENGS